MNKRKYLVTYPIVGFVTLEVEASSVEDAKTEFFAKTDDVKLVGDVLNEIETEYSWDFVKEVNTGSVCHCPVQEYSVSLSPIICPVCTESVEQDELDMFGGMCESCAEFDD